MRNPENSIGNFFGPILNFKLLNPKTAQFPLGLRALGPANEQRTDLGKLQSLLQGSGDLVTVMTRVIWLSKLGSLFGSLI